ncbi:unnamed protein product [Urochloa decumbens]|uniref:Uncharacterized protein n=1 Tax=Urochloa decumbens TaxID=240449 RepID=A0ABC9BDG6_9POAL
MDPTRRPRLGMEASEQTAAGVEAAAGVPHSAPAPVISTLRISPQGAVSSIQSLLRLNQNMQEDGGADEAYRGGATWLISHETRTRVPPELSPSIVNICKAYNKGLSHDIEMEEDDDEEEDADYEMEDDEESDQESYDDEEEDDEDETTVEEAIHGLEMVDTDMGSFSEPGCGGYNTRVPHEQAWQPTKRGAAQPTVLDLKTCGTSRRTEEGSGRRSLSWNRNYCKERKDS